MPAKGQINPEIRDEHGKIIRWNKRNREASNALARALRAKNPEKIRAANRSYRERNPYSVAVRVAKKRAEEFDVKSTLTREEWETVVREAGFKCHICGHRVNLEIKSPNMLSLDHIVPLSRGGENTKENVFPAHRRCNQARTNMTLDEFDVWLCLVAGFRGNGKI